MTMTNEPPGARNGAARPRSTVLIVEPDATIAHLLVFTFQHEGHAAEAVTSPHEALALLAARGPDVFDVILSAPCALPAAPYAWLDHLRARARAPIVICTRSPAEHYADHRAHGCAAVIEEPCDLQELLDVVAGLLPSPAAPGSRDDDTGR